MNGLLGFIVGIVIGALLGFSFGYWRSWRNCEVEGEM